MSGNDLHDGFTRLLDDEPPMHIDITPVVARGQRMRLRKRMGYAAGGLGVAGLIAAAVAVPLALSHDDNQQLKVAPIAAPHAPTTANAGLTAQQQRILAAIEHTSPDGFTFAATADRWDGPNLEGEVNDGGEPGRFMVGFSPTNGSQLLHPCNDSEYRQGGTCNERTLADGSVLSMRGLVDFHGIRYIDVALTHPDGSGVNIENGNFRIKWPLPERVFSAQEKRDLTYRSRANPAYTVDQLGDVALAVDRALNG
jgi:hypothetical protein